MRNDRLENKPTLRPVLRTVLRFLVGVLPLAFIVACGSIAQRNQSAESVATDHQPGSEQADSTSLPVLKSRAGSADVPGSPEAPGLGDAVAGTPVAGSQVAFSPIEDVREVKSRLRISPMIDLTAPQNNLWRRIRNGFSIPDLRSPLVEDRQNWYASHPEYLDRIAERCRLYLHYIVDELEKRHMPMELALLPMVESAFNPMAYSPAQAAGLWQFIPSTGKSYNLKQNWWYDGRRDVIASTRAALDYLQFLYEMHGDWQLALASYNWGENAVAKAIERNRARGLPTEYSSLGMPLETRYYVPKLQALENIISNPKAFGIDLDPIPNRPYFAMVETHDIDIDVAAKLAEMPLRDLVALNPAHKRRVILAVHSETLVLPAERVKTFQVNLERRSGPLMSWLPYRFKRGDKLAGLAQRHGITLQRLKDFNGITRHTRVVPGMTLLLPIREWKPSLKPVLQRKARR